ncbi:MAG: HipA domain-containing protein [Desulfobacterales bacterium]|jgi:serine/threonine-protein kinase HipA
MDCQVQVFFDNSWKTAAVFEPDPKTIDKGIAGGGRPQYDKVSDGRVERLGMHSLYAVANIPGYGAAIRHDTYCHALAKIVTDSGQELREYIRRDILNFALRNTDNHGRNTAVLRKNGQIKLSPLFDFAPMFLDPVGIGRVSRWEDERPGSQPEWANICEKFKDYLDPLETRAWLAHLGEDVKRLAETMKDCHIEDEIIQRLSGWIDEVAAGLVEIRPRTWT